MAMRACSSFFSPINKSCPVFETAESITVEFMFHSLGEETLSRNISAMVKRFGETLKVKFSGGHLHAEENQICFKVGYGL